MRDMLRLQVLLDPSLSSDLPALAAQAAAGGATLLQLRMKDAGSGAMLEAARAVMDAAPGVPLIVNDRVEVALAAGAAGVHLGWDDLPPRAARALLGPEAILGLTVRSAAEADAAELDAVTHASVGGVFATATKRNSTAPVGLDGLAALSARLRARKPGLPVCAIAGIGAETATGVIRAGADGIAVTAAVASQADPEAAARGLRAIVDAALAERGAA